MVMIFGGVRLLEATNLGALRTGGDRIQEALGVPVTINRQPMIAKVFPMLMMTRMMVLIFA